MHEGRDRAIAGKIRRGWMMIGGVFGRVIRGVIGRVINEVIDCIHSWRKGSVNGTRVFVIVSICGGRGCEWYTCVYVCIHS